MKSRAFQSSREPEIAEDIEGEYSDEALFQSAKREESPLSFEYVISQLVDIESQDKETLLSLFSKKIKGDFFYYVVPRLSKRTFLICQTEADRELLTGPLSVYWSGRYIGKTILSEKKPGENYYFNLGADRQIKVNRKKIKDRVKETFFGKIERNTIIKEMGFKITLENLKDKPINIHVIDSVPISRTDRVKIDNLIINPEPKEKKYQGQQGVLLWELNLKEKEKKEILIDFTISHSNDLIIEGL